MELFNSVFGSWYPPLRDVVCNVDTDLAVEAVEQPVWAHTRGMITAVVVGKLREREQFGPDCLIVHRIGPQIVFNDSVQIRWARSSLPTHRFFRNFKFPNLIPHLLSA